LIISHKFKFVFVKTRKTAGTSIEMALRPHLGPDDVATPIREDTASGRSPLRHGREAAGLPQPPASLTHPANGDA